MSKEDNTGPYGPETAPLYPNPEILVELAFSKILPDGSVEAYDQIYDESFCVGPYEVISIDGLPPSWYDRRLHDLATSIHGAVVSVGLFGSDIERQAENLAPYLAHYRDNRDFVAAAAACVQVGDAGCPVVVLPDRV
jgi:hypothetical protein